MANPTIMGVKYETADDEKGEAKTKLTCAQCGQELHMFMEELLGMARRPAHDCQPPAGQLASESDNESGGE